MMRPLLAVLRAVFYFLNQWLLRLGFGGLFIYAGVFKAFDGRALLDAHRLVPDSQQFALDVQHYEITTLLDAWWPGWSWTVSVLLATYLPWLEIFVGLALLTRRLYFGALAISATLAVVFLAAIGSAWWRGIDLSCGCFGKEVNPTSFAGHIAFNVVMLVTTATLAEMEWRRAKKRATLRA